MYDVTAAPKRRTTRYVPHELVRQILLRLPVEPLQRLTCVCKAWHSTITGDHSFQRERARLQEPHVLIAPQIKINDGGRPYASPVKVTTPGLYRWEKGQGAATLVQAMDSFFPVQEAGRRHDLAHCDGLVLVVSADDAVRVLNPATRHATPLPRSYITPTALHRCFHGALGLGHDPRSNAYKVARIYYRSVHMPGTGGCLYTLGMEVFTIGPGRDQHWRQTTVPPPYPIMACRTATFFEGSLLWTIDESILLAVGDVAVRGFLRFSLEDETFSVIPAPPGCPDLRCLTSNLVEMHGELCLAHEGPEEEGSFRPAWIWMCNDVDGSNSPRWVRRHVMNVPCHIHLIAMSNDRILFQGGSYNLMCYDSQSIEGVRHVAIMHDLTYHHPDSNTHVKYPKESVYSYDLIPYVPSLVPI